MQLPNGGQGVATPVEHNDAFLYGAGAEKLGFVLTRKWKQVKKGNESKVKFLAALPALDKLVSAVQDKARTVGHLKGLDGRLIHCRSPHAALNTLLQGAGAVQMKRALCLLDDHLQSIGLTPGPDYEFVANVHDEWQIECSKDCYETVGKAAVEAIRLAGESFRFGCPLGGEWKHGRTWADTH